MNFRNIYLCLITLVVLGSCKTTEVVTNSTNTNSIISQKEAQQIELYTKATTDLVLGNKNQALGQFLQCINLDENNAAANYQVAKIYFNDKKFKEALEYSKKTTEIDPKNKFYWELYSDLLIENREYKESIKAMNKLIELEPENIDYQLQKADIHIFIKEYKPAIKIFDDLESKIGINQDIALQKQKLYLSTGNYNQAEKETQKLIDSDPTNPTYHGLMAEFYETINKKEKALESYLKVETLDPNNPIIHFALANFYQEKNDIATSFEYIKKGFKNPDADLDSKIKILLSYMDLLGNDLRKLQAFELLDILKQVHPESPKTWSIYGDYMLHENNVSEAAMSFEKTIEKGGTEYPIYIQLCKIYYSTNDFNKLSNIANQGIELFPTQSEMYLYASIALYQKQEFSQSIAKLNEGKGYLVNDPIVKCYYYLQYAKSYNDMNDFRASDDYLSKATGLNVLQPEVNATYAYVYAIRKQNLELAQTYIEKALASEPKNIDYLVIQALIYIKSNKHQLALDKTNEFFEMTENYNALMYELKGDVLYKTNMVDKAVENWKLAEKTVGYKTKNLTSKVTQKKYID